MLFVLTAMLCFTSEVQRCVCVFVCKGVCVCIGVCVTFLALLPDVVLNVSEQSRVQRASHSLRKLSTTTSTLKQQNTVLKTVVSREQSSTEDARLQRTFLSRGRTSGQRFEPQVMRCVTLYPWLLDLEAGAAVVSAGTLQTETHLSWVSHTHLHSGESWR